jgi:hypothetical protein
MSMNNITKTMLAGAALCALSTAPVLASGPPTIHLVSIPSPLRMNMSLNSHFKTDIQDRKTQDFTETVTFTGALTDSADLKTPVMLWGETWYSNVNCTQPANETAKFEKSTVAKITTTTSTGTISGCGSTIYTFYGPLYDLKVKSAKSDSFSGNVSAKKFSGYNLDLVANTDLTIKKK